MSVRRRIQAGLACVAMLGIAAFAIGTAPTSEQLTQPFYVSGASNEPVETRTLTVEVQGARLTRALDVTERQTLTFSLDVLDTEQTWVIVDAVVEARVANISLDNTRLRIGGVEYRAIDYLPPPALVGTVGDPGIPIAGSFAFEVPTAVLDLDVAADAELVLRSILSSQLDDIAVVAVDLSGLTVTDLEVIGSAEIAESRE